MNFKNDLQVFHLKKCKIIWIVTKAFADIKDEKVTVRVILDKKEIKSYEIKDHEFDETKVTFDSFNPKIHYFGLTSKSNNEYFVYFHSYPTHEADFMKTLELLDKYNIKDCYEYMSNIKADYVDGLTKADIYRNLSNAGVDNWCYYYEAKSSGFDYDNLNETLQYEYFKDNEDLLAKKWENYTKFKKELYGIK